MCTPVAFDADASAWVAVASTDDAVDAQHRVVGRVTNVGTGARPAAGVVIATCPEPGALGYALHLDAMFDVGTWAHHEADKAWFLGGGFALEGDVALGPTTSVGVHLGIERGEAFLPFGAGSPWNLYEVGARVGIGPVRLGLDAFTQPGDLLGARGVIVRVTPRGTPVGWAQVMITAVALGLLIPAFESPPVF